MSDKIDFKENPIYGEIDEEVLLALENFGNNVVNIEITKEPKEKDSGRISFS